VHRISRIGYRAIAQPNVAPGGKVAATTIADLANGPADVFRQTLANSRPIISAIVSRIQERYLPAWFASKPDSILISPRRFGNA